ncbi:hypothetical protein FJV76_14155 [Mesorhizobium sp. WSM4303]|uniref:hypothetical protein n=1 Tax=Mesorhizobium sp. WSM4303 TaxID=2589887 RepID=UPI00115E7C35|nr:hypothetical protein [Mesorhizobium sp. WSM4303]TRD03779.1 hypothetical protein FJV76_14155 [Mesorhizobium sp. WSM4303]
MTKIVNSNAAHLLTPQTIGLLQRIRGRRRVAAVTLAGVLSVAEMQPVRAAQVVEDDGTVYAEMVNVEQVCSFLGSPALSSLADLKPLNREAYDLSFREFSSSMDLWLTTKIKSMGIADQSTVFASDQTQSDISSRFNICFGLHSADQKLLKVLGIVFNEEMHPPSLWFRQINLGRPVELSTVVFIASMKDGNEYLNKYLQTTASLIANRVATARESQAAPQSATPNGNGDPEDPGDDLDSVFGGAPAFAQYTCEVTAAAVYGVPNFNGASKEVTAEISVQSNGNAIINGKPVKPAKVFPAPSGTDLPFSGVVYGVLDVKNALFSTEGLGPGLLNPSQDELQALEQLKGIVQGTTDSLLAGRTRYLGISLANDTIFLGDVTPDGNLVNRSMPNCTRTR